MNKISVLATTDTQWDVLEAEIVDDESMYSLRRLIAVSRRNPILSTLYPFLSVGRLCFSRCIGYPFYVDVLIAACDQFGETYSVQKTVGQGGWADTEEMERACGPDSAVQKAAALLPAHYGPAREGDANQWRECFNRDAAAFRVLTRTSEDH